MDLRDFVSMNKCCVVFLVVFFCFSMLDAARPAPSGIVSQVTGISSVQQVLEGISKHALPGSKKELRDACEKLSSVSECKKVLDEKAPGLFDRIASDGVLK